MILLYVQRRVAPYRVAECEPPPGRPRLFLKDARG
jgi:hypothetical protein